MRINNKGFAISSIMYLILVLALILMVTTLALLSSRKLILDKMKKEVSSSINNGSDDNTDDSTIIPDGYLCAKSSNIKISTSPYEEYVDTYVCNVAYDESSDKYTKYTFYKLGIHPFTSTLTRLILNGYYDDTQKYSYFDAELKTSNLTNSWNLTSGVTLPFLTDNTYNTVGTNEVNNIANNYWLSRERLSEEEITTCKNQPPYDFFDEFRYFQILEGQLDSFSICSGYPSNYNFFRPVILIPADKIKD